MRFKKQSRWGAHGVLGAATKPARRIGYAAVGGLTALILSGGALVAGAPAAFATQRYYTTGDALTMREAASTTSAPHGTLPKGSAIDIVCQVQGGTNVNGNTDWDKLTNGYWVADYWTNTPTFNGANFPAPGTYDCNRPSTTGATPQMQAAANWAIAEKNSPDPTWSDHYGHAWSGWCEQFVEQAEGFKFRFDSAIADYQWEANNGRIHTDANPPLGALVFYGGANGNGHVAVSIGGGQEIGTLGSFGQRLRVSQYPVIGYLSNPYLGWALPIGS